MKLIRKIFISVFLFIFMFTFACSGGYEKADLGVDPGGGYDDSLGFDSSISDYFVKESYEFTELHPISNYKYDINKTAGMLTGSIVFDNDAYAYWKSLIQSGQEGEGIFKKYFDEYIFDTSKRIHIQIENASNVKVELEDENYSTYTDALGNAYLFAKEDRETYDIKVTYYDNNNDKKSFKTKVTDGDKLTLNDNTFKKDVIELMLVMDTTGSMGDELSYLQKEIIDVISQVQQDNLNATIKLALLFYRDKGDEYVTRYFDFTTDIISQIQNLEKQNSNGGGDFEEAVYKALGEAVDKQWSSTSETRLILHVADAPSHDEEIKKWYDAVTKCASKGIKIITIASSGIDKKTEYFFRSQSMMTGGAYVFLTDDSGIGDSHLEATTEEALVVEYLNKLLIRLINGYHTGDFKEAESYDNTKNEPSIDFPDLVPDNFNIVFKWGEDLKYSFNMNDDLLLLDESYKITITDEDREMIYNLIKSINLKSVTTSETIGDLYLEVTCDNLQITINFYKENGIIDNSTDYKFYLICEMLHEFLISKIQQ